MQALEETRFVRRLCCVLSSISHFSKWGLKVALKGLYSPQPTQDIHRENSNARSGGNAGERLFCAGFAVREAVASDHDRHQTCNLRNGTGKEALDGRKARVER